MNHVLAGLLVAVRHAVDGLRCALEASVRGSWHRPGRAWRANSGNIRLGRRLTVDATMNLSSGASPGAGHQRTQSSTDGTSVSPGQHRWNIGVVAVAACGGPGRAGWGMWAGTTEDVAATVMFLASPAARHLTGQVIHVNGGAYLGR